MMREKNQSDRESESKIKNDIHIYTHMPIDRKIPHDELGCSIPYFFTKEIRLEMLRRGLRKREHIKNCERHIFERDKKKYSLKNLSLLSLIESLLIELGIKKYSIDPLKIEIFLVLINQEEIFRNKKDLMETFHESKSLDKALFFFSVLQSYLVSVGKMLVVQQKHDYLINKAFEGELTLTPTQSYDSKYGYFSEMETLYF